LSGWGAVVHIMWVVTHELENKCLTNAFPFA
jgi:hypothetical protein